MARLCHPAAAARHLCRSRQGKPLGLHLSLYVCLLLLLLPPLLWPVKRAHPINLIHLSRHPGQRPVQVCVYMCVGLRVLLLLVTFHLLQLVQFPFSSTSLCLFSIRPLQLPSKLSAKSVCCTFVEKTVLSATASPMNVMPALNASMSVLNYCICAYVCVCVSVSLRGVQVWMECIEFAVACIQAQNVSKCGRCVQ